MIDFKKKREELRKRNLDRMNGTGIYSNSTFARGINIPKEVREEFRYFIQKGDNYIDILPYIVGKNHPVLEEGDIDDILEYSIHRNLGVEGRDTLICPRVYGNPCKLCQEASKYWKLYSETNDEEYKEKYNQLRAKKREIMNIIDVEDETPIIKILDISKREWTIEMFKSFEAQEKKYGDIKKLEEYDPKGILDRYDPELGSTIHYFGVDTDYKIKDKAHVKPNVFRLVERTTKYDESILEKTYCLSDFLVPSTSEDAEKYLSIIAEDENDADVDLEDSQTPYGHDDGDVSESECPHGFAFGKDHNKKKRCVTCDDALFAKCKSA